MKKTPITAEQKRRINNLFAGILQPDLLVEMEAKSLLHVYDAEEYILHVGDQMTFIPIILEGSIKVVRENNDGEELLLYYIEGGDTCAMTLQCCMRKTKSEVKALAIESSTVLMIPIEFMEIWMEKYASWRAFILQSYHARMMELLETIDAMAFMKLDERLLKYLSDQAKITGSLELSLTHQQIAEDLNSSRVVISRLLKQLEVKGGIQLFRNKIVLATI
jgi:CRP/FNR family transcriptional regulator